MYQILTIHIRIRTRDVINGKYSMKKNSNAPLSLTLSLSLSFKLTIRKNKLYSIEIALENISVSMRTDRNNNRKYVRKNIKLEISLGAALSDLK